MLALFLLLCEILVIDTRGVVQSFLDNHHLVSISELRFLLLRVRGVYPGDTQVGDVSISELRFLLLRELTIDPIEGFQMVFQSQN